MSWTKSLHTALVSPSRKHEEKLQDKTWRSLHEATDLSSATKEKASSSLSGSSRSGGLKGCQFHGSKLWEKISHI